MKCMDGPSDTEMDREGLYEMDRKTKCQKMIFFFKSYPFQWRFHFLDVHVRSKCQLGES